MRRPKPKAPEKAGGEKCAGAGMLYPPRTLFLRESVGEASGSDGSKYELSINAVGRQPIIRCGKTGRWWTVGWQELVELAVAGGISRESTNE